MDFMMKITKIMKITGRIIYLRHEIIQVQVQSFELELEN